MSDYTINDPIYDDFVFETIKLLDEIEEIILKCEKEGNFNIYKNIISRYIHTIKGNSMVLDIEDIAKLSHACEDLVLNINSNDTQSITDMADVILEYIDYLRNRLDKLNDNYIRENMYSKILIKIRTIMKKY